MPTVRLERFREEAELLFRLSSAIPCVVRPLQFGTLAHTKGRFVPFIALGWAWGYAAKAAPRRESLTLGFAALFTFGLIIRAMTTGR